MKRTVRKAPSLNLSKNFCGVFRQRECVALRASASACGGRSTLALRAVFSSDVHAAGENGFAFFRARGRELCEAFLTVCEKDGAKSTVLFLRQSPHKMPLLLVRNGHLYFQKRLAAVIRQSYIDLIYLVYISVYSQIIFFNIFFDSFKARVIFFKPPAMVGHT